ncbi:MAG: hypothetical protein ACJAYU_004760 [Bradymonadia bacterium]
MASKSLADEVVTPPQAKSTMQTHFNAVAVLHLLLGGLKLLLGGAFVTFSLLFGGYSLQTALRLLGSEGGGETKEAILVATGLSSMSVIPLLIGLVVVVLSFTNLVAAYGVMRRRSWAPAVALITSLIT